MRSNCLIQAALEFRRRCRAWRAAGMPVGEEPYLVLRPSRHPPRWVPHAMVGRWREDADRIEVESFKPTSPQNVPWWLVWTRLRFTGRWVAGDRE